MDERNENRSRITKFVSKRRKEDVEANSVCDVAAFLQMLALVIAC